MNLSVANCKTCGKVFQKRISSFCPDCIEVEEQRFRNLYRALQATASKGGIPIEELAHEVEMTVDEIEGYYLEGRLGTAGILLAVVSTSYRQIGYAYPFGGGAYAVAHVVVDEVFHLVWRQGLLVVAAAVTGQIDIPAAPTC